MEESHRSTADDHDILSHPSSGVQGATDAISMFLSEIREYIAFIKLPSIGYSRTCLNPYPSVDGPGYGL